MSNSRDPDVAGWLETAELLEALAAVEHERWSHWQRFMHSQGTQNADGTLTIPSELVARWTQQMNTPYESLSDAEKESDREQAREYLETLRRLWDGGQD